MSGDDPGWRLNNSSDQHIQLATHPELIGELVHS
jgi:hypothetical protein